jgi:hypothetical protein
MAGRTVPSQVEATIYAALRDAAMAGEVAPTSRELRERAKCHLMVVALAIENLEKAGKLMRRGGTNTRSYYITALRKATEPAKARGPGLFRLKRDPKMTPIQRATLSVARRLILENGTVSAKAMAAEMGENIRTMETRLSGIHKLGHLRYRDDRTYESAIPPEAPSAPTPAQPRIEFREGFSVPVTICPPMLARGALVFRSALGFGGMALAGGGSQRPSGRAS